MGDVYSPVAEATKKVKACMTCRTVYVSNRKRRCCKNSLTEIGWITNIKEKDDLPK